MAICWCCIAALPLGAQQTAKTPAAPPVAKAPENPAQIELLETHVRFETDGSSRKEVHARVRISSELGARQFAHLDFNYNRGYERIEIPLLRVTHRGGGTADILPSAITDQPDPVVAAAPAYQDVRVKSVRILGLEPGDSLEYRVITAVLHHPLAPDFWLEHSFDRTGVVSEEILEVDLPAGRPIQLRISPETPPTAKDKSGQGDSERAIYRWQLPASGLEKPKIPVSGEPDVVLTTFASSRDLSRSLALLQPRQPAEPEISRKSTELTQAAKVPQEKIQAIYDFVSHKIATVDVPLGSTGFRPAQPVKILSAGYATPEDKFVLFAALASAAGVTCFSALVAAPETLAVALSRPSLYTHQLIWISGQQNLWLDPGIEVAPFGVVPPNFRGRKALILSAQESPGLDYVTAMEIPLNLPFASYQEVTIDARLASDGKLSAKIRYVLRGDNELLLRVAFHKTPRDKWKEVAQLLSLSDGFRGQVGSVSASDPYAATDPFTVEYEITQPHFVDWSKKPVHIPALLPLLGLPEATEGPDRKAAALPIDLGTPLDVKALVTLHLPSGTGAQAPAGTSVERDYAVFSSAYTAQGDTVTATRHINFLRREVPATRSADYNAFLHVVRTDQSQVFTLDQPAATPPPRAPRPKTRSPAAAAKP